MKGGSRRKESKPDGDRPVSLTQLAKSLNLSPTTLSLVLNRSAGASTIPQETQDRIFAAVAKYNYRPNFLARSLRSQRTYSAGVLVPEVSDGYSSLVLSGIEEYLIQEGYLYLVASHRHKPNLISRYPSMLLDRCVEGLILIDTPIEAQLPVPVICVSGHRKVDGVTNIILNHRRAADLGLQHLVTLGHRRIAFIKGQPFSSDTDVRWEALRDAAKRLEIDLRKPLVAQLEGDSPSPEVGYIAAKSLLASREPFTAVLCFNDISAIGAIRAFHDAGLRVPEDVSVVGFDDARFAAFHNPALTTIRQPLHRMGVLAADLLLKRIVNAQDPAPQYVQVEPELVIRESTSSAPVVLGAAT